MNNSILIVKWNITIIIPFAVYRFAVGRFIIVSGRCLGGNKLSRERPAFQIILFVNFRIYKVIRRNTTYIFNKVRVGGGYFTSAVK